MGKYRHPSFRFVGEASRTTCCAAVVGHMPFDRLTGERRWDTMTATAGAIWGNPTVTQPISSPRPHPRAARKYN